MPAIRACLEHRHAYVRRNAVLAIYTIYRYARDAHLAVLQCTCQGVSVWVHLLHVCWQSSCVVV